MPKNSFLQAIFKGPKFSVAPIEQNNRGSVRIGEVVPVFATVLNPREGIELDMGHLVRFLPTKAPVMEGYKLTFDAFAVPFSTLGYAERKERDIDDFFNIKINGGETANPFCVSFSSVGATDTDEFRFKYGSSRRFGKYGFFKTRSLSDYLNMPSLKAVKEHVRKWLASNSMLSIGDTQRYVIGADTEGLSPYADYIRFLWFSLLNERSFYNNDISLSFNLLIGVNTAILKLGVPFVVEEYKVSGAVDDLTYYYADSYWQGGNSENFGENGVNIGSLLNYILHNYPAVADYYGISIDEVLDIELDDLVISWKDSQINLDFLQVLYDKYGIDAQSIYDEYFDYVCENLLYNPYIQNSEGNVLYELDGDSGQGAFLPALTSDDMVDMSYHAAYWKIISDWYINTNIDGDPDDFFLQHCNLFSSPSYPAPSVHEVDIKPFVRRWPNDIFTSCVPMAEVNNVRIPADGTIPDLREANAYQKLVDIFRNTGNRLRDVIYGVFGITPSAVRSEMSEPIGTASSWIGIQSVLQTSQTTVDSPQAAYAGVGTDSQGHGRILKYVNNSEPTPVIIMVLMSVTQRASYMQGFDRKFFRKSIYDFAIPELAMIGEQELTNKEIYFDKGYEAGVFGFNRRYYDWFYSGSEVHGDLRESLDFWHGARYFDEQPRLNSEFIGIEAETDHLQRIFANVSESSAPVVYNISFDGFKTVALPRYIQYEL